MSQKTETKVKLRLDELKEMLSVRLKDVLENQNLSQSELARNASLKIPYVNRILRKKANATLESIARLETALKMKLIEKPEGFEWLNKPRPKEITLQKNLQSDSSIKISEMFETE